MLTLHISETDIEVLKYERYTYPSTKVQKRMQVLYIRSQTNLTNSLIAQIVGLHRDTVTEYVKRYNQGGLASVYAVGYGTNESKLEEHSQSLLSYFEDHPPHSINEAREKIKELTGIQRSPTQIRSWLKRHGLRYRKAGQIPGKADQVQQAQYLQTVLNPLIEKAQAEEIHLLFMDAAHFVMGVFLCCLWSAKRVFIKSSSGRKRYNVLGAVDAITKQVHTWTNESYINSNSIVDFFINCVFTTMT
ncbi:MAG: IS630 family transposase [Saprospiraceae bacterium]